MVVKNLHPAIRFIAVTVMFFSLSASMTSSAQTASKRVLSETGIEPGRQSPVEVVGIKAASGEISPDQPFTSDDDWFRDLTVTLKNVSGKSISFVEVDLFFSETTRSEREAASLMLRYGNMPSSTNNLPNSPPARYIPPGETFDLKMSGDEYERVQGLLQREGVRRSVGNAKFLVRAVFFDGDGEEMWSHGGYLMKRDPQDPKTYRPVGLYVRPNKPE